jgi:hypothetical protein
MTRSPILKCLRVVLLLLPWAFLFAPPGEAENLVTDFQMTPASPAALEFNLYVTVSFHYLTDNAGGVRILALPFTRGAPASNYLIQPSPFYGMGGGSGSYLFSVSTDTITVDQVRIQMFTEDESVLLFETFIPVTYFFGASGTITNLQFSPPSPASLVLSEHVNISFDYTMTELEGVKVIFHPFSEGFLSPDYAYQESPRYGSFSGSGSSWVTVKSGPTTVEAIRIAMFDAPLATKLIDFFVPVSYFYHAPVATRASRWGQLKREDWADKP